MLAVYLVFRSGICHVFVLVCLAGKKLGRDVYCSAWSFRIQIKKFVEQKPFKRALVHSHLNSRFRPILKSFCITVSILTVTGIWPNVSQAGTLPNFPVGYRKMLVPNRSRAAMKSRQLVASCHSPDETFESTPSTSVRDGDS